MTRFHRMPAGVDAVHASCGPSLVVAEPGADGLAADARPRGQRDERARARGRVALRPDGASPVTSMAALRAVELFDDRARRRRAAARRPGAGLDPRPATRSAAPGFAVHHAVCQTTVRVARHAARADERGDAAAHGRRSWPRRDRDALQGVEPAAIARLAARAGVTTLGELGVTEGDLDEVVEAVLQHPAIGNTPGGTAERARAPPPARGRALAARYIRPETQLLRFLAQSAGFPMHTRIVRSPFRPILACGILLALPGSAMARHVDQRAGHGQRDGGHGDLHGRVRLGERDGSAGCAGVAGCARSTGSAGVAGCARFATAPSPARRAQHGRAHVRDRRRPRAAGNVRCGLRRSQPDAAHVLARARPRSRSTCRSRTTRVDELDEKFTVSASGALVPEGPVSDSVTTTIIDDDVGILDDDTGALPTVSLPKTVKVAEGNRGTRNVLFNVRLSTAATAPHRGQMEDGELHGEQGRLQGRERQARLPDGPEDEDDLGRREGRQARRARRGFRGRP